MFKTGITGLALLALLAVLTTGCGVPSVHPLYTEADVVAQPEVVGMWVSESTSGETWKFFKKPKADAYTVIYTVNGVPAQFNAHFTRIGNAMYMDTWPVAEDYSQGSGNQKGCEGANLLTRMHLIAGHLLWRVEVKEPVLRMATLDPDKLTKELDAGTASVAHEYQQMPDSEDKILILTAPTAQLREFVLKSADKVFDDEPMELRRKPAKPVGASAPSK